MKPVSSMLRRLSSCSGLFAAVVLVSGLVLALPASVPAATFTFTPIDAPGASLTRAFGINATGQIVGLFRDATGTHGFLDTGGVFTPIDVPGASLTSALGINATGQIVGLFVTATGTHGFLDTGGVFTPIDVPGASLTEASGINATGQIVGDFDNAAGTHGFLDAGGVFTPIDVPGATITDASGINATGRIVGDFDDAAGTHGFLATPTAVPAPSTLLLLGTGLAFGAAWNRIRRRSGWTGHVARSRRGRFS